MLSDRSGVVEVGSLALKRPLSYAQDPIAEEQMLLAFSSCCWGKIQLLEHIALYAPSNKYSPKQQTPQVSCPSVALALSDAWHEVVSSGCSLAPCCPEVTRSEAWFPSLSSISEVLSDDP